MKVLATIAALAAISQAKPRFTTEVFMGSFDMDGDGYFSAHDYGVWCKKNLGYNSAQVAEAEAGMQEDIDEIDLNGDGVLDRYEISQGWGIAY